MIFLIREDIWKTDTRRDIGERDGRKDDGEL